MTRISEHTATARTIDYDGTVTELGEVRVELNLDESQSPYGEATLDAAFPADEATLAATDPRIHRGLRLLLEMRESVGDPVIVSEITADHTGSVAAMTAAYGPALTPAKVTAQYFTAWNDTEVRPGGAISVNLLLTGRDLDHEQQRMTFTAQTDEALAQAYRLVSTTAETSGTLTVRGTVNYALAKVGAVLLSGATDATIVEAEAIIWAPATSAWDYVSGVAEAAGLVVRCDERRRWTLTPRSENRPEAVVLNRFTQAREQIELASGLWADAVVVRYTWNDATTGAQKVRYDTASDLSSPIVVVEIDRDTPYPGPGAAQYWLNRLRGRGRVFELEGVSDYTIRPGMGMTASLPLTPAQVGWIEAVSWALPDDRATIRTRGSADATPNAIDLWPDGLTIDQLTGVIDSLVTAGV